VTIVEFSNFECPYCQRSWTKIQELLEKRPQDVRYVFKHFPLQAGGTTFALSEMAAAAQEVSPEAFWLVHDFLFSDEGQALIKGEKQAIRKRIEKILQEKGLDLKVFQTALDSGKGKQRVEEDMGVGKKIGVRATPTTIVNGDILRTPLSDQILDQYLKKQP